MKVFIADNELRHVTLLKRLLERTYPKCVIWPADEVVFERWQDIAREIQVRTHDGQEQVIILDLALESSLASVRTGMEEAFQIRGLRPNSILIAYTQFTDFAEGLGHYRETFDGLIDKQRLIGFDLSEEQQTYVRQIVSAAIRKRSGARPLYAMNDSLGLRLALAVFGQPALDALVDEIGQGWEDVEVAALTSGHSGASILAISGKRHDGGQRIIVKCARDRETIEDETRIVRSLSELGPLGEVLAPIDQTLRPLLENRGYYYRQADIAGDPLLAVLQRRPWGSESERSLRGILDLELRCYNRVNKMSFGALRPVDRFGLTPIDVGRAKSSLNFLAAVGRALEVDGQWPRGIPCAGDMVANVLKIIDEWPSLIGSLGDLMAVTQHGDLNPGNVLIPVPGQVVLIDLAHLGSWPVGYDIARLACMLRLRMTDHMDHSDWVKNRLATWLIEEFCTVDKDVAVDNAACPPAMYCDQRFRRFLGDQRAPERRQMTIGYRLGTLWDLVKVLSYGDLSPFKRLWALIGCWQLGRSLELRDV